jgi:hypothetical protein
MRGKTQGHDRGVFAPGPLRQAPVQGKFFGIPSAGSAGYAQSAPLLFRLGEPRKKIGGMGMGITGHVWSVSCFHRQGNVIEISR